MKLFYVFPLMFSSMVVMAQGISEHDVPVIKNGENVSPLEKSTSKSLLSPERFSLRGYGAVNYYNYGRYDTDYSIKNKMDAERLNLYLEYKFNDQLSFKSEIEFEHGGTGVTMELDHQEEAGEIETELEKGGEVKIEQINVNYTFSKAFNIRAGRLKLYFNAAQNLDYPTTYFTTHRQEMENIILPLGWYENGIEFHGIVKDKWRYYATVTNGLDSSGFSSGQFIKNGYQQKFEMQNAESLAYMARLDYLFGSHKNTFVGVAGYFGNTNPNRPKKDMNVDGYLNLLTAHINYDEKYLRFSGAVLYGNLQNSDKITVANTKLPNALGAKRTPVGKNVLGISADIGYEILHFFIPYAQHKIYPFVRYDFYDTMYKTAGLVIKKDRWERSVFTGGINYFIHPQIVLKAQYSNRVLGSEHVDRYTVVPTGKKQKENFFSIGVAFTLL